MEQQVAGTSSVVMFRNCEGLDGRGTLLHLTRTSVVFEVYNPYSIVQLSEVLQDLKIIRGERTIYSGRAVVSNLVTTGLMVIVSATLVDPWSDLVDLTPGKGLREESARFLDDWISSQDLRPSFRLAVGSIRAFLGELSQWLEQAEVASNFDTQEEPPALLREFVLEVREPLESQFNELYMNFEDETAGVSEEEAMSHKAHARRELHPLIMCSPFLHRTFAKPLGHAGDFQMVNMMTQDSMVGASSYARLLNSYHLNAPPVVAHRNRISILADLLKTEAERVAEQGKRCRILNIGCGPAAEVKQFLADEACSEVCEFHLLDFADPALDFVRSWVKDSIRDVGRGQNVSLLHKSVHQLLRSAAKREDLDAEPFDYVYCAGLFDYLSDRVCARLTECFHQWVNPGGLVVVTNVHPVNPIRGFMEFLTEWHLIYRDEAQMLALATDLEPKRTYTDSTGINIFLEIRKAEH